MKLYGEQQKLNLPYKARAYFAGEVGGGFAVKDIDRKMKTLDKHTSPPPTKKICVYALKVFVCIYVYLLHDNTKST